MIRLGLGNRLDGLGIVGAHGNLCDVDIAVAHCDACEVLLLDSLAGRSKLGDSAGRSGLRGLAAGIGVDLCIEDDDVDVLTGSKDMIQTAVADIVGPAVAAEDIDGLLGEVILFAEDLGGFLTASLGSLLKLSHQSLSAGGVGLGVILGGHESVDRVVERGGSRNFLEGVQLADQLLADRLLAEEDAVAELGVILKEGVAPGRTLACLVGAYGSILRQNLPLVKSGLGVFQSVGPVGLHFADVDALPVVFDDQRVHGGDEEAGAVHAHGKGFVIPARVLHDDPSFAVQSAQLLY